MVDESIISIIFLSFLDQMKHPLEFEPNKFSYFGDKQWETNKYINKYPINLEKEWPENVNKGYCQELVIIYCNCL